MRKGIGSGVGSECARRWGIFKGSDEEASHE